MDEQIKIGTEDCSVQKVMKVLKESESFLLFYDKWQDFAEELHIERLTIKELDEKRILHQTYKIQHVVRDLLELWVSKEGSRATLDLLLSALEAVNLVALKDRLNDTFVPPNKANADAVEKAQENEPKQQSSENSLTYFETVTSVRKETSIDDFVCPVCLLIPEAEIYQCSGGHMLCSNCYSQRTECPECQNPLDKGTPIRNIPIEKILDRMEFECLFKQNGCEKKLSRKDVPSHKNYCCFDFQKFGYFVNLCKIIGYPSCDFKFNNGKTIEAVEHFVSKHGCNFTTFERFQMELVSFIESVTTKASGYHYWTPIIANLEERKCYLLTMVILNKIDACFTWVSIFLPYLTNEHRKSSPVDVEYSVKTLGSLPFTLWIGRPMSLKEAIKLLSNEIDFVNYSPPFFKCCSNEGNLPIYCNIRQHGVTVPAESKSSQRFVCSWNKNSISVVENNQPQTPKLPIRFRRFGGSVAATSFRDKLREDCKRNRNTLLPSMRNLFERETPTSLTGEDVEWLKTDLIFVTAWHGNVEALEFLIRKRANFNIVDEEGRAPLHYTMYDIEIKMGLEKAELLIDSRIADVHVLDDKKWSVLHFAVKFGNNKALEYFCRKRCDVNAKSRDGLTPLHYAVTDISEEKGLQIVDILVAKGADVSIKNMYGKSALDIAAKKGKTKIAELLGSYQSL